MMDCLCSHAPTLQKIALKLLGNHVLLLLLVKGIGVSTLLYILLKEIR